MQERVVGKVVFRDLLPPSDVSGGDHDDPAAHVVLGHVLVARVVEQGEGGENGGPDRAGQDARGVEGHSEGNGLRKN